jgi:hypothetical protein
MKTLRDALIVIVLGSVMLWFAMDFFRQMHESSVNSSIVVQEATLACRNDAMICSFSSEESAQAYLNSPEHKAKVAARDKQAAQEADFKKRVDALVNQGTGKVKAECRKVGFRISYCDNITNKYLEIDVEGILRERDKKLQEAHTPNTTPSN